MLLTPRRASLALLMLCAPATLACFGLFSRFGDERETCEALLDCVANERPDELAALTAAFGDDSDCWDSRADAERCALACEATQETLGVCGSGGNGTDTDTDTDQPPPRFDPAGDWAAVYFEFDDAFGQDSASLPGLLSLDEGLTFNGSIELRLDDQRSGVIIYAGQIIDDFGPNRPADHTLPCTWAGATQDGFILDCLSWFLFEADTMSCASIGGNRDDIQCETGNRGQDFVGIRFQR